MVSKSLSYSRSFTGLADPIGLSSYFNIPAVLVKICNTDKIVVELVTNWSHIKGIKRKNKESRISE